MKPAVQLQDPELWPITVDWELDFLRAPTRQALAYWRALAGGRRMPARSELSPRAMKNFIAFTNLIDVTNVREDRRDYMVSLQSGHSRDVLGDVKGRRLCDIFPPTLEQRWRECFDLPSDSQSPVRLLTRASTQNKNWLACEVLLAPLGESQRVQALFWVLVSWPASADDRRLAQTADLRQR